MIVGFVLVLLAIAGGVATFAYVCRMRQFAIRSQYLQRHAVTQRPGSVAVPGYPAPLVQLRPVATLTPAAEDEGTVRECPICFEEVIHNKEWLLLACKHGVCMNCYQKLVQDQHRVTTCPFCRMPLLEPEPMQPPSLCVWTPQHIAIASSVQAASWVSDHHNSQIMAPTAPPQLAQLQHGATHLPVLVAPMTSIV